MKRTIPALALLGLLLAFSLWNLHCIDALTEKLCACVSLSVRCVEEGDAEAACAAVDAALQLWQEAESYTHIFLRHSEVDGAADALYALAGAVYAMDAEESRALCGQAVYHLRSLQGMEHPSMGSVF